MIRFENIRVVFDDYVAIPDLTLEIPEGDFFTLLGPSGCGKTTALRVLAGLIDPAAGSVYIDGKDVTKLPSDKREIGMVFQNYALFPTMTVRENIGFGLKVAKTPRDEIDQRVRDIAKEVELTDKQMDRNVSEMSGGQQQRVAIARSLIMRPKILLLDEPLSNLDAKLRQQLRLQLKDMQRHFGITSVYVTHDQTEALTMSDGIAVMNAGSIEQVGTPREVYSQSSTEFVCNFIGDVNRISLQRAKAQGFPGDGKRLYARIERVHVVPEHAPRRDRHLYFEGSVVDARYEGATTTYAVEYGEATPLKLIVKEERENQIILGQKITLAIRWDDILEYEGER